MEILRADHSHVSQVARLFDLYRQFYECDPDLELATAFIGERIDKAESTIFVAMQGAQALGFVQLYPSFCSVDAIPILILYDLYVDSSVRVGGIGEALMNRATAYARVMGCGRVDLLTGKDNLPGQRLYEKLGYCRSNEDFYSYSLTVE
jgi:ribosomal protein S18 acetylase RimI-like enzyme